MADDEQDEERATQARIYKLADKVQEHEGLLIEHKTILPMLTRQLDSLQAASATREGLTAAVTVLQLKMDSSAKEYTLKLDSIENALSLIQRGINWTIGIILTSVLVAVLALVLKK